MVGGEQLIDGVALSLALKALSEVALVVRVRVIPVALRILRIRVVRARPAAPDPQEALSQILALASKGLGKGADVSTPESKEMSPQGR